MQETRITFTKKILERVSFDPRLFCKELEKALKSLLPYEIEQLADWLLQFVKEKPELRHCVLMVKP
ncbi:hypothetical protein [Flavobacterium sp. HJ-32-4]|uniref:hypothetical protein n=1 Tax=Flavobacterium sp. HJ-32-4 TaxID=1160795 RepID=UPI001F13C24B|nr:hypothetical protein [Flavobacterium sp. HJ-32-4]UMY67208.1 hypothetical protein MKO97_09715 [Flavobacterium sp. HJ-32-4]